jgi:hypothetical protein
VLVINIFVVGCISFNDVNANPLRRYLRKDKNIKSPNEISISKPVNKQPEDWYFKVK